MPGVVAHATALRQEIDRNDEVSPLSLVANFATSNSAALLLLVGADS